jgi:hypothetical protein
MPSTRLMIKAKFSTSLCYHVMLLLLHGAVADTNMPPSKGEYAVRIYTIKTRLLNNVLVNMGSGQ